MKAKTKEQLLFEHQGITEHIRDINKHLAKMKQRIPLLTKQLRDLYDAKLKLQDEVMKLHIAHEKDLF